MLESLTVTQSNSSVPVIEMNHLSESRFQLLSPDVLVTGSFCSTSHLAWSSLCTLAGRIVRFIKSFFCFFCYQTTPQTESLEVLQKVRQQLPEKLRQYNEGVLTEGELQRWWSKHYELLSPRIQRLLLLEDIKLRTPEGVNRDLWADVNYIAYKKTAEDFVVNLYKQGREGIDQHDPIVEVPHYIDRVIALLEIRV